MRIVNVVNFILLFVIMIELSIRGFALFKIFLLCETQTNISPNSELKKSRAKSAVKKYNSAVTHTSNVSMGS